MLGLRGLPLIVGGFQTDAHALQVGAQLLIGWVGQPLAQAFRNFRPDAMQLGDLLRGDHGCVAEGLQTEKGGSQGLGIHLADVPDAQSVELPVPGLLPRLLEGGYQIAG